MIVVRPCSLTDLPAIEDLALESDIGITTLPVNKETLQQRVELSLKSFEGVAGQQANYLFVLEEVHSKTLLGVAGVVAHAGMGLPFYSYRREDLIHSSQTLGIHKRIPSLHLCHDLTDKSQLCSFYVRSDYRQDPHAELLSRARCLFLGEHKQHFGDSLLAEIPGVLDQQENSPFWDSVGKHFFGVDYGLAEYLSGVKSQAFLAEMMPPYPIYVPLLSQAAQSALGQPNVEAMHTLSFLRKEGLKPTPYVDIFDGGPTVIAKISKLLSVQHSRVMPIRMSSKPSSGNYHILTNTSFADFRATLTRLPGAYGDSLSLDSTSAQSLNVTDQHLVRVIEL